MPILPDDERLLHRALALAEEAAAFASPNPAVGCVLARGDELLGEGAHRYDLRDHAEIVALKDAAARGHDVHDLRGATAYVTLEPCSHHGRTGPCADALIAAGMARCVVATVDPNPQVRGEGLAKLRHAGMDVVLAEPGSAIALAARRLNDAFAFAIRHARPFVTLKSAVSADGKLAPNPLTRTNKTPHWITGEAARADVQLLRHRSDALLTGIGTVLADDPALTDRTGLPRRRRLLRVVLDSALRMPLDSQLVRSATEDLLLIASADAPLANERTLRARGIEIYRLPPQPAPIEVTVRSILPILAFLFQNGLNSILVEAGPALNGALLAQDLVDQLILYTGPNALGPEALPFALGQPAPSSLIRTLTHVSRKGFPHGSGEDIRSAGYLHDPWQGIPAQA